MTVKNFLGITASSKGSCGMRRQAAEPGPIRPASAHIVRIGTENVRSLPYRASMDFASADGATPPAAFVNHASARHSAVATSSLRAANANAAHPSAVVLMLLKLRSVSPQP